jgi:hypothetical protein
LTLDTQDVARRSRSRTFLAAFLIVALLAAATWLLVGRHVYGLYRNGMHLRVLAQNPASLLFDPEGAPQVKVALRGVEQALRGLRVGLGPLIRPGWLPWRDARENLFAADELLRVGAELTKAGQAASDGLLAVADALEGRRTAAGGKVSTMTEALAAGLGKARPSLVRTAELVGQAAEDVSALNQDRLWRPLSAVVPMLERYLWLGHVGLEASAAAPALLGEAGPVHYLVLAQNNDELRATGGFVTAIGVVSVERGKIGDLAIQDSYYFDKFTAEHPWPPEPMTRYMGIDQWVTRDGNWSPDFPTAAQDVEDLYHIENSTEIHGVVAFDMSAVGELVRAVGPLYLEEFEDWVDGDNVLDRMREYWGPQIPEGMTLREWAEELGWDELKTEWWLHRKDFIGLLADSLMTKLQSGGAEGQLVDLAKAVWKAMDEKHILMRFHEPAVQGLLARMGMDGALDAAPGADYLLALDTNMGYNKVNVNVARLVEYQVTLRQAAAPQATVTITYQNHSPAQEACVHRPKIKATYELMTQDCYWNYLRIYVPLGSELLSARGVTQTETISDEHGKTVFAAFFMVPAAETRTVSFTYRLPDWDGKRYRLVMEKQAGTEAVPVRVRIQLPSGAELSSAQPEPHSQQEGVISYDLNLRRDRSLALTLR